MKSWLGREGYQSAAGTSKSHFKGLEPLEGQINLHKKKWNGCVLQRYHPTFNRAFK